MESYRLHIFLPLLFFLTLSLKAEVYSLKKQGTSIEFQAIEGQLYITGISSGNKKWITTESADRDLLWQLSFRTPENQQRTFSSRTSTFDKAEQRDNSLTFSWKLPTSPVGQVHVTIEYNPTTNLSEWSLEVELPDRWRGTDALFPVFNINKDEGNKLIVSSGYGAEYDLDKIDNMNESFYYPSSRSTMQLICLHDTRNVFYYATHDKDANMKTFSTKIGKNIELSTEIVASDAWNKDGRFSIPWKVSIGLAGEGWEKAVETWYRPFTFETVWGRKTLEEKQHPEWLLNSDLWLHGGHTTRDEHDMTKQALDYFGGETSMHWYYWMHHDYDTKYPDYLPPRDGFHEIIDMVHNANSHIMPYTNGRLWDTLSVRYKEWNAIDEVALTINKKPTIETYLPHRAPNAVVCPSSDKWKEIILNNTRNIHSELNPDAFFYDQVASARPLPCYNELHDHPVGGGDFWHYSYRDIFTEVRSLLNENQIIGTEQNAECFLDLFDVFFMTNLPFGTNYTMIPLFPLVYSDRALLYGFNISITKDMSYRLKSALSLVWGAQLYGGRSILIMNSDPQWKANAAYIRDLTYFRKRQHDLFVGGKLLGTWTARGDNPVIDITNWESSMPAVVGARWLSTSGQEAIVMVNFDNKSHEIILPDNQTLTLSPGQPYRYNIQTVTPPVIKPEGEVPVSVIDNTIILGSAPAPYQYFIYSVSGQLVKQGMVEASKTRGEVIAHKGIYIVNIVIENSKSATKVLVR